MNKNLVPRAAFGAIFGAVVSLTACGGGGGDDGGNVTPTTTSVNIAAFEHNRHHINGQWTLTDTASTGTLSITLAPTQAAAFPLTSVIGNTNLLSFTASSQGVSTTLLQTLYFDDADLVFGTKGSYGSTSTCATAVASSPLPTTAKIGDSGPLYVTTEYSGCDSSVYVVGQKTLSWSVFTESGIVFVCENTTATTTPAGTASVCFESDANGVIGKRARFSGDTSSGGGVLRNY